VNPPKHTPKSDIAPAWLSSFLPGVHVYLGPHPRRALALDLLPVQQIGRQLWQATMMRPLVIKQEFCHRRGVFKASSKTGAPSGWHVLRPWRCVAPPPPRVAKSLPLATRRPSTWPTMILTGMSATSTASTRTPEVGPYLYLIKLILTGTLCVFKAQTSVCANACGSSRGWRRRSRARGALALQAPRAAVTPVPRRQVHDSGAPGRQSRFRRLDRLWRRAPGASV
jgi:hypothetical protein